MKQAAVLTLALLLVTAGRLDMVAAQRDSQALLELVDRGYENLLIGISGRVSETENPGLLDRIKFVFTEASKFLFQATKGRAYFKEIHILVPESWSDYADYSQVEWQRYDQSDVIIDTPSETSADRPYVNKPTPCGEPGKFIHFTPDYLQSRAIASVFGPYDKTVVHEWAHYRWGVFDEYPLVNDQQFYANGQGNIEAVRCVSKIPGRRLNPRKGYTECETDENGLPERDCRFVDDQKGTGYTGSLMYKQYLPAISTFCEKAANGVPEGNQHNIEAPNIQNNMCQGKSIWEVMLQHRDFASTKGENDIIGKDEDIDPVPTFKVVKKRSSRLVLVLDRSGSMKGQRLRQLRQAAEHLITQILLDGEQLGIVDFEQTATIRSVLRTINDGNRRLLLNSLPVSANGWTSIGSGIVAGLDVLNGTVQNPLPVAGGKILVITDGGENESPKIKDVLHLVNGSGVTVDTIAIGSEASIHLELLSSVTGGNTYYHSETSNSLADAFGKSPSTERDINTTSRTLYSEFVQIPARNRFSGSVFVDASIGRNTQFLFGYSTARGVNVRLTSPDGTVLTGGSSGFTRDDNFMTVRIAIPGNAEVGLWRFQVTNNKSFTENVTILVESYARDNKQDPILVKSYWGRGIVTPPQRLSLYVEVGQGYTPVVDGNVTAVVDLPGENGNETVIMQPKDDGIGPDIRKDDGIYSAYFTKFSGKGRYGVTVKVKNKGNATSVASGSLLGVGAPANPEYTGDGEIYYTEPTLKSTGDFQRVSVGDSFKCEGSLCNGTVDIYPPDRITDLAASNVNLTTKQVELRFTAPGDDLMSGTAMRYIIVSSFSVSDIYEQFHEIPELSPDSIVQGDVTMPKNAREKEKFVIRVNTTGSFSYAFAVVAIDDEGNRGAPSNVATASARMPDKINLGLIAGLAVGGGVILLILVVVLVIFVIRRKRSDDNKKEPNPFIKNTNIEAELNPYITTNTNIENGVGTTKSHVDEQAPTAPIIKTAIKPPAVKPKTRPTSGILHGQNNQVNSFLLRNELKNQINSTANNDLKSKRVSTNLPDNLNSSEVETAESLYDHVINRQDRDPNWDPTVANNREGGGAHIKAGHVANTKSAFDNLAFRK